MLLTRSPFRQISLDTQSIEYVSDEYDLCKSLLSGSFLNSFLCVEKDLLYTKTLHLLFFAGGKIIFKASNLSDLKKEFNNPMIHCFETDLDLDLDKFANSFDFSQARLRINTICHIDIAAIQSYCNDISIYQIIDRVWGSFSSFHIFNNPYDDHIDFYKSLSQYLGDVKVCHPVNNKESKASDSRDIKYDPTINHFYAANTRQPLHTDYAYYPKNQAPDWLMLYCVYPSLYGGITSLLSTSTLKKILFMYDKKLYKKLCSLNPIYSYEQLTGDLIHQKPVLSGQLINWNYWQIKDSLNTFDTCSIRDEFFRFLEDVIVQGSIFDFSKTWKPGDCIMFRDQSYLHCRSSFIGDRWLKDHAFFSKINDKQ